MTSNQTPATCLTDGHCVSPDDTTDTCMRCGAVDGWIPHTGNECPVPGETMVDVKTSSGFQYNKQRADILRWAKWGSTGDITHYRIVTPANHPALGLEPLNIKATVTDEFGTYPYEYWQKKHAKPNEPAYGKTLRDEMAMAALTGLLSSPFDILDPDDKPLPYLLLSQWAHAAYILADAMMEARRTPTEGE